MPKGQQTAAAANPSALAVSLSARAGTLSFL